MQSAAVFLSASILITMGLVVITAGMMAINRLFHKYWKPVKVLSFYDQSPKRFVTEDEYKKIHPKE